MFQDGSDRSPTDSPPTPSRPRVPRTPHARGRRALATVPASRTHARVRGAAAGLDRRSSSVRRRANASRVYNTEPEGRPPSPRASRRRRTGRGAPPAGSAPVADANVLAAPLADATTGTTRRLRVESDGRTLRSSPFASKRFHVLLNSLFKVLFNFPSRYLFAIGLVPVFSLRWSLPPTLGCIIKQPDSEDVAGSDGKAP